MAEQAKAAGSGCQIAFLLIGIVVIMAAVAMCSDDSGSANRASSVAPDPQFACLSAWDGSLPELVRWVRPQLRNPGSFEHVETRVTAPAGGRQTVFMEFRAENGFGGLNIGTATAALSNPGCTMSNPILLSD